MAIIPVDLTTAGLVKDGTYRATIQKIELQAKVGDKWNKDGTTIIDNVDEWLAFGLDRIRIRCELFLPEIGQRLWHDVYFSEGALWNTKRFVDACGVQYDQNGFNPEDLLNKDLIIDVVIKEDPEYGPRNEITSFKKA